MKRFKITCLIVLILGAFCSCGTAIEEAEPEEMQPALEETAIEEEPLSLPLSEVKNVVLYSMTAVKQQELSESEKAEVLEALADVEWSGTGTQSYLDNDGGVGKMFRLELEDGREIDFSACSPFYIIDELGYKSEYRVCQAISKVYWRLNAEYFAERTRRS